MSTATAGSTTPGREASSPGADARAKPYDAFVSYSHADAALADGLVSALHGFAKPWYRVRGLHLFRDTNCLAANPLWESIEAALDRSRTLLLLASPEAARSPWVAKETDHWCRHNPPETLLLALTAGDIVWDDATRDFDWTRTTALPSSLQGRLPAEPLFVDLRWVRQGGQWRHDGRYRDAVATLAATLHGRPKDDLVGEDVRRHRGAVRLARAAVTVLVVLTVAATMAAVVAVRQRDTAREQRRLAVSRQLAAESAAALPTRIDRALLLAVEAVRTNPTAETRGALLTAVERSAPVGRFLVGHDEQVTALAVSADGRRLVSGDRTGRVLLWDLRVAGGRPRPLDGHHVNITAAAFAPDGDTVVTADGDGNVMRWRADGTRLTATRFAGELVALDTDGARMAVLRPDSGTVDVLDSGSARPVAPALRPGGRVDSAAFSPDGRLLATASGPGLGTVVLWDVATGARTGPVLRAPGFGAAAHLTFGSDGRRVTAADSSSFAAKTGNVCTWSVATGEVVGCAVTDETAAQVAEGSGTVAGAVGKTVVLVDGTTGQNRYPLFGHGFPVSAVAVGRDGQVVSGDVHGVVIVWEATLGGPVYEFGELPPMDTLEQLGSTLAAAPAARRVAASSPAGVDVWQAPADHAATRVPWQRVTRLPVDVADTLAAMTLAPDGRTLVTASPASGVLRWDVDRGRRVGDPLVPPAEDGTVWAYRVAMSPDGHAVVLAATHDTTQGEGTLDVQVRDGAGRRLAAFRADVPYSSLPAQAIAVSNTSLAYFSRDGVVLRDLATARQLAVLARGTVRAANDAVALSPDGRVLAAAANQRVTLWDTRTGDRLGDLVPEDGDDVWATAFSADGAMLALSDDAQTVSLWDVATRRQVGPPLVAVDHVTALAFLSDTALVGLAGDSMMVVDLDPTSWVDRACAVAGRNLTAAEWAQYLPDTRPHDTCPHP